MSPDTHAIRAMTAADWPAVAQIYAEGIATGDATFTTDVPAWEEWDGGHVLQPRLVATDSTRVIGWAALSAVSKRPHYRGVVEVSVYVGATARGRGVGRALLAALIEQSEAAGIWTLVSSIFPENEASVALHRRLGFREVGRRERIAQHAGVWRDTLLMERRSRVIGW